MSRLKSITQVLGAAAIASFALQASAQAPSYGPSITTAAAKKVAAGVIAECQSNKWNIAVAIVDTSGGLVYFERMEDTQSASLVIAIDKASASARYRRPTRAFVDAIAKGGAAMGIMTLPGVVGSPGGVPIVTGGKIIGAVGVSGVTGDQDEQCAKAGVAAM